MTFAGNSQVSWRTSNHRAIPDSLTESQIDEGRTIGMWLGTVRREQNIGWLDVSMHET